MIDIASLITVRVDRAELARGVDDLLGSLEQATYRALDAAAQRTAEAARASHWYRNRTGDLQGSTQAQDAEGPVWSDGASSSVAALMPYAQYVDRRSPILLPAYAAVSGAVETDVLALFAAACAR